MMSRFAPVLAALTLALSACNQGSNSTAPATEAAKAGIAVSKARVVLPAVQGNPGAAYFDLANRTDKVIVLTGVAVAGAERTEMHETKGASMAQVPEIAVAPGQQTSFAPGGRHVMVFGAPPRTAAGETRAVTLTFKDGHKEQAEARLEAPGGDSMDMEHGAMH